MVANGVLVAVIPLITRLLSPIVDAPVRGLGLGSLLDTLVGNGGFTDIGLEVAGARGLVDPGYSTYDAAVTLNSLIGMGAYDIGPHTHPPTSMVLWLPLTWVEYHIWLSFFAVISFSALALSMRVMKVPALWAYSLALLICLTPMGIFGSVSTYPLSALVLALAWIYRDHTLIAGPSYAFLAASRGIAALLLVYPVVKRQWKTLLLAIGFVVALAVVAVAIEPSVISDFLTRGRQAIDINLARLDLLTFDAVFARRGLPRWLIWIAALTVVAVAVRRHRDVFWPVVWFTFAVTPIAWIHSTLASLPLLVVMWQSGRLGRVLTVIVAATTFAILPAAPTVENAAWPIMVVVTGIAVIACPLGAKRPDPADAGRPGDERTDPPR